MRRGPWLGMMCWGRGRAVKTYICTYKDMWGRSDGRPTSTGRRSGTGCMWTLGSSMERCLFRSYLEILIDVWTCTNQIGELLPQDRPMCTVASLSRSLPQVSFLVYRHNHSRVSRPTRPLVYTGSLSFPHTRRLPPSSPASPTRVTEVQRAVPLCTLPSQNHNLRGRTLRRRNITSITADHRSAIITVLEYVNGLPTTMAIFAPQVYARIHLYPAGIGLYGQCIASACTWRICFHRLQLPNQLVRHCRGHS